MSSSSEVDAVIVGAGVAGLYQLHLLRNNLGLTTRVIEAGNGVGGTWHWSKYPGARCDIESAFYSYSFSPELEREWTWTEKFSTQEEILRYVNHVADRFDLRKDIKLNTRVTSAVYNENTKQWQVHTNTGETILAQFLIMATGALSVPKMPDVPGIESFQGLSFHTGEWPDEGVDLTGKRVGVIGTGSSAVQSIPIIAEQASELWVFQRSPAFCHLANNRPLSEEEITHTKANYQAIRHAQRNSSSGVPLEPPTQSALEVTPDDRRAKYEFGYQNGSFLYTLNAYTDMRTKKEANDTVCEFVREKIRSKVRNPKTAEALSPRSYPFGAKRVCLDSGYYVTFNSEHVHLVDLKKTLIFEITPTGVRTSETEYPLDVIVYATGYDAVTGALSRIDIRGKRGESLKEKWAASGPKTYLGLATAGFPNMFMVTGPQSPSVFVNMTTTIEQHVEWIANCIEYARKQGIVAMEAAEEAEEAWVAHSNAIAERTLIMKTDSWYNGANVAGKPRVLLGYIGGFSNYVRKCEEVVSHGYEGFLATPSQAQL